MALNSKNKINVGIVLLILFFIGISLLFWIFRDKQIACTMEAKLCPDGSYVGRVGSSCEFAACPGQNTQNEWETFLSTTQGLTFQYPTHLSTTYIYITDWPPQIQITDGPFSCTETGEVGERAGRTERRTVNNREYCVTEVSEGAAGSIYTQYAYVFPKDGEVLIFTFSLRAVQCGNYGEEEQSECESEREMFYLDGVIDRIAQTLKFGQSNSGTVGGLSGKIEGNVLLGPICPTVMDPPDQQCADKPYKTRLVVVTPDQSKVIKEFSSDTNGKFSVTVPPGEYEIRSAAAANVLPYCAPSNPIKVSAKAVVTTTINCDTSIR